MLRHTCATLRRRLRKRMRKRTRGIPSEDPFSRIEVSQSGVWIFEQEVAIENLSLGRLCTTMRYSVGQSYEHIARSGGVNMGRRLTKPYSGKPKRHMSSQCSCACIQVRRLRGFGTIQYIEARTKQKEENLCWQSCYPCW